MKKKTSLQHKGEEQSAKIDLKKELRGLGHSARQALQFFFIDFDFLLVLLC